MSALFESEIMKVKKLTPLAHIPVRGSEFAAGYDLKSAYDLVIPSNGKAVVKTDLAIAIPEGTYARIAPRSGLAVKKFIDTGAGVVDYDYRGNVGVVLFNHGTEDFEVKCGDRIAQLILERISMASIEVVEELPETTRGAGGFGSTGVSEDVKLQDQENQCNTANTKRQRTSQCESLLLFLHDMCKVIGDERKSTLKVAALSEDVRLIAAMKEYERTQSSSELIETVDIIIKNL